MAYGAQQPMDPRQRLLGLMQQPQQGGQAPMGFAPQAQPLQAIQRPQGPPQGLGGMLGQRPPQDPYADLNPSDRGDLYQYDRNNYQGADYTGRHEANQFLTSQYAQMLRQWAKEPALDYSAAAPIHDQFGHARDRLTAQMSARGIGGSGIEAGAQSGLYGQEAASVGDFIRQLIEQRRKEHLAQQLHQQGLGEQVGMMGLQRNYDEQMDPGFFGDLAGVVGGVGGKALDAYLGGTGPFSKGA